MKSQSPVAGNPNPASGYIVVQLQDNYNKYYFGGAEFQSPNSGSSISISGGSVMTVGNPYTIVTVGTSTTANWNAVGVPVGTVPAVGVTFIATVTGGGTGTGTVMAPLASGSGIVNVEVIGFPNTTIVSQAATILGSSSGAYVVLRCMAATAAGTTTLQATSPARNTVMRLKFLLSNSTITNKGD